MEGRVSGSVLHHVPQMIRGAKLPTPHEAHTLPKDLFVADLFFLPHVSDYRLILCDNGIIFFQSTLNLPRWKLRLIGVWLFVPGEGFRFSEVKIDAVVSATLWSYK